MITGELRSKIDGLKSFRGISNPLTVIEQITYLLFIKDSMRSIPSRKKISRTGQPIEDPIFLKTKIIRWSRFKEKDPETMFEIFKDKSSLL